MTDMSMHMKAQNGCINKAYCVNVQYRLLFTQKERGQRVNEGKVCIVTNLQIFQSVGWQLSAFSY